MPKRRRFRRRRRRRRPRARKRRRMIRYRSPITKSMNIRFRYALSFLLSGVEPETSFRANSIFDPETAVGGHQPMGADEYSAFFNRYTVMKSKITVTMNNSGATVTPVIVMVQLDDTETLLADPITEVENGRLRFKILSGTNGGPSRATMSKTYNARTYHSIRDPVGSDALTPLFSANPNQQAFFHVSADSVSPSGGSIAGITVWMTIDYFCHLSVPKDLIGS